MEIKCKASGRFIQNLEIEDFFKKINELTKANVSIPIRFSFPCSHCKMVEVYEVYPTHYIHIKSYKREK